MVLPPSGMIPVLPAAVLEEIAAAIPEGCHEFMIVTGSLAVGYRYFKDRPEMAVRTKDADCLVSPRIHAVEKSVVIVERLLEAGWVYHASEDWPEPGRKGAPLETLPAPRLHRPGTHGWFLELLTVPEQGEDRSRSFLRVPTAVNDFAIPSFGFLSLHDYHPDPTPFRIFVARPEMMALANLLEHPEIRPDTMSGWPGMKRSNKDLGRVIAIAWLAMNEDPDALRAWPGLWERALRDRFPTEHRDLARRAGRGLRQLLASPVDLEQAHDTCVAGLLALSQPSREEYGIAAERLIVDAIEPLESAAGAR
ncbi:MAG: hypothetical protein IH621_08820 [Krumholzibacteria bacterium]|nr:hypothetical protein [Candidatus Krumholzibacteria bacterium]